MRNAYYLRVCAALILPSCLIALDTQLYNLVLFLIINRVSNPLKSFTVIYVFKATLLFVKRIPHCKYE